MNEFCIIFQTNMHCSSELWSHSDRYFRCIPDIKSKDVMIERLQFSKEFSSEYKAAVEYLFSCCTTGYLAKSPDYSIPFGASVCSDIEENMDHKFLPGSAIRNKIEDMYSGFISMFSDWISFIDNYLFINEKKYTPMALKLINCVRLNDCGVIDYKKTAEVLLAHPQIDDMTKLKIACLHCMEEEIRSITRTVKIPTSLPKYFLYEARTARIVEFWKHYLKNDQYRENVEELIHQVNYNNESAVKFFWRKLNVGQKCYNLQYILADSNAYSLCTWLNEMTTEEQLNVLNKCGGQVLEKIRKSFIWSDHYFLVAFFARHVIPNDQYYTEIRELGSELVNDYQGLKRNHIILRTLWSYLPRRAKLFFFQQKDCVLIFAYFHYIFDFDFLRQLLADGTWEFMENFLFSSCGLEIMSNLINDKRFDDFNELFKAACPILNDAFDYKVKFLHTKEGFNALLRDSLRERDKNSFDEIMQKIFLNNGRHINKFKKQFLFESTYLDVFGDLIHRVFYTECHQRELRQQLDYKEVLTVIRWFLCRPQEIDLFKATKLCYIVEVKKELLEILRDEAFDLTNTFLKWAFNNNVEAIAEYKADLFGDKLKKHWRNLICHFMQRDNRFQTMDDLVNWIYTDANEKRKFKERISKNLLTMHCLWKYLLYEGRFDMADVFLKWCGFSWKMEKIAYMRKLFNEISWGKIVSEDDSASVKMEKCVKIIDWMGLDIDGVEKAEFSKKIEKFGFNFQDIDSESDEDDDEYNESDDW